MQFYKFYLFLFALQTISFEVSANYLYTELDGGLFKNSRFNFSIFIRDFIGMLFYGFESKENRFLIEFEEEDGEKIIDFKTKRLSIRKKSKEICKCSICENIYLRVLFELSREEVTTECNGERRSTRMNLLSTLTRSNQFTGYPIPKQYRKDSNKLFIWMGNIGFYTGDTSVVYKPLKNQLKGCLDKFYFNHSLVSFQSIDGSSLLPNCPKEYNETICTRNNCTSKLISYDVSDCSLSIVNGRYCRKVEELTISNKKENIYRIRGREKIIMFQLKWKQMEEKNYCLMEIEMSNGSMMIIYINKKNEISINSVMNGSLLNETKLSRIDPNDVNILSLIFDERTFFIRIFSEDKFRGYNDTLIGSPTLVTIAKNGFESVCVKYEGAIDLQFDLKSVQKVTKPPENPIPVNNQTLLLSILGLIGFFILSIIVLFYFIKRKMSNLPVRKKAKRELTYANSTLTFKKIDSISMPMMNNYDEYTCIP